MTRGREQADTSRRRSPRSDAPEDYKARMEELVNSGLPVHMARAVAKGKLSLNEALEKLAFQDRVRALEAKHNLTRALATQVAMGHANLDRVLANRRYREYRASHRETSSLTQFHASGEPVTFAVHGQRQVRGQIAEVLPYAVRLAQEDGEIEIHKLQVKYAFRSADFKKVRKGTRYDTALRKEPRAPIPAPQDRYGCSDRRFFRYVNHPVTLMATTLEGEVLKGTVTWFSRYEFGFRLKNNVDVVFFRHALSDLAEV